MWYLMHISCMAVLAMNRMHFSCNISLTLLVVFQKWDTPFIDWILTNGASTTALCSYWILLTSKTQISNRYVHTAAHSGPSYHVRAYPAFQSEHSCAAATQGYIIVSKPAYQIWYRSNHAAAFSENQRHTKDGVVSIPILWIILKNLSM